MESQTKDLAELLRTIGLNAKFMDDRRKEVQVYACTSQAGLFGSFPLNDRTHYSHDDIKKFLQTRCIGWKSEEFQAILEQINPAGVLEIQASELGLFVGLSQTGDAKGTAKDAMLDAQFVRLFEQAISNHRRIEPIRQRLRATGNVINLYRLLEDKTTGTVAASRLIDFLLKHGSVDTETLGHLFREIEKKNGLTFMLLNWWLEPAGLRRMCAGQFRQSQNLDLIPTKNDPIFDKEHSLIEDLKCSATGFSQSFQERITKEDFIVTGQTERANIYTPKEKSQFSRRLSEYQSSYVQIPTLPLKAPANAFFQQRPFTSNNAPFSAQRAPISDRCFRLEQDLGKTERQLLDLKCLIDNANRTAASFVTRKPSHSLTKHSERVVAVAQPPVQIVRNQPVRQFALPVHPLSLNQITRTTPLR